MPPSLVRDFLELTAERLPQKAGLVCRSEMFCYAELEARANQVAQALLGHGLKRGQRVVIHLPNTLPAVVGIFGALKAGAVFVPVNPTTKADKLAFILRDCRASALMSEFREGGIPSTPWLKLAIDCTPRAPARTTAVALEQGHGSAAPGPNPPLLHFEQIQADYPASRPPRTNAEEDLACLIYTSGSTGQPKGVMCEHRNVVFVSGSIIQYLGNTEADVVLNVLPLAFDYGLYQLLMTFRFGGTLVLEQSFAYPSSILPLISRHQVTGFPGVPTIFALLLGLDLARFDFSSLRYLTNTGAALAPRHVLELRRKFSQARLFSMYGLTETKRTLYLPPEELERRPGSVGIPIPGTEAWIENEYGQRVGPDEVGQLVVCGPHVMRGYWGNPWATAERFGTDPARGQRLCYSGDLFRQDTDGFFYFVARKDDIIKSRGEKVAPKEVENVLYGLSEVTEAAVIGIPDPVLGQAIKAFVVCGGGARLSATEVLAHCRARLEDFMVPRAIEFCDTLPKNASGKIDKLALARNGTGMPTNGLPKLNPFNEQLQPVSYLSSL